MNTNDAQGVYLLAFPPLFGDCDDVNPHPDSRLLAVPARPLSC